MGKSVGRATAWAGPWLVHFFKRHHEDDADETVPAERFLDSCPISVRAKLVAILKAVAEAPPPRFAGGGKWEAMHGEMGGLYEARADGPRREHYRLFCVLEREAEPVGLAGPSLIVLTGLKKPFRTTFGERDYEAVRALAREYRARVPRSVV